MSHAMITTMTPRTTQPLVDISCSLMTSFPSAPNAATRFRPCEAVRNHSGAPSKNRPPCCRAMFRKVTIDSAWHAVTPSPRFASPIGVGVAPLRDIRRNASVGAQFRCDGAFGDFWRRQHAGINRLRLPAREHHVGELLVFERHLGALDVQVIARTRQPLGEMTPVRRA